MTDRRQSSQSPPNERRAGADRRRANRVPLGLDFAVPVTVRMGDIEEKGLARNISEGGMLVQVDRMLPIGRKIEVTFRGKTGVLTLDAEIRHQVAWQHSGGRDRTTMYGIGVRFLEKKKEEESLPQTAWVWSTGPTTLH
jgi:c-di-GMP-binding flagellar brake protein YcgR